MLERLQKIIARAGIASRRHAEELIRSGQVRVNGVVVSELGAKADPEHDRVEAAGRVAERPAQAALFHAAQARPCGFHHVRSRGPGHAAPSAARHVRRSFPGRAARLCRFGSGASDQRRRAGRSHFQVFRAHAAGLLGEAEGQAQRGNVAQSAARGARAAAIAAFAGLGGPRRRESVVRSGTGRRAARLVAHFLIRTRSSGRENAAREIRPARPRGPRGRALPQPRARGSRAPAPGDCAGRESSPHGAAETQEAFPAAAKFRAQLRALASNRTNPRLSPGNAARTNVPTSGTRFASSNRLASSSRAGTTCARPNVAGVTGAGELRGKSNIARAQSVAAKRAGQRHFGKIPGRGTGNRGGRRGA